MEAKDMILICKALSDTNRLEIVQMLSDGEKCGCKILDKFDIRQPTLSHHMKMLGQRIPEKEIANFKFAGLTVGL